MKKGFKEPLKSTDDIHAVPGLSGLDDVSHQRQHEVDLGLGHWAFESSGGGFEVSGCEN